MKITINGQTLDVPPAPELVIDIHADPADENFGPCIISVYGGSVTFTGNAAHTYGGWIRRGDNNQKLGLVFQGYSGFRFPPLVGGSVEKDSPADPPSNLPRGGFF